MLILAHLADRPAHGDEIKKHVERTLGGSPAINNLLYPALHVTLRSATTLAHFAAVPRADQRAGHRLGTWVVQFLTRQREQELERIAFPAEEMRGETL
jgi:hypothetical protein